MLHLAPLLLAQAATEPSSGLATGGLLGGLLLVGKIAERFWDDYSARRRRNNGHDEEHQAKTTTRRMISELTEGAHEDRAVMERIAAVLSTTAETQRQVVRELENLRRENEKAHDHLMDIVRGR